MYEKPTKPNPKKDRSARRKRKRLYWLTGGRQISVATVCNKCVEEQKADRSKRQGEKPAPYGQVYILNQNVRCKNCQKEYDLSKRKPKNSNSEPRTV